MTAPAVWTIYPITLGVDGRRYVGQTGKPAFLHWVTHVDGAFSRCGSRSSATASRDLRIW